jgi:hypothetical protein
MALAFALVVALGVAILTGMTFTISVGPLESLTLSEKLSLMEVLVGAVGFALATAGAAMAWLSFERSIRRSKLFADLVISPVPEFPAGDFGWRLDWFVRNAGSVACRWFSLDVVLGLMNSGSAGPIQNALFAFAPYGNPEGGRWSRIHPDGAFFSFPFPLAYKYQSNGECVVFDRDGVDVSGPRLLFTAKDRHIEVGCVLRAENADPWACEGYIDLDAGKFVERRRGHLSRVVRELDELGRKRTASS